MVRNPSTDVHAAALALIDELISMGCGVEPDGSGEDFGVRVDVAIAHAHDLSVTA